jgi:hypothetical protein
MLISSKHVSCNINITKEKVLLGSIKLTYVKANEREMQALETNFVI